MKLSFISEQDDGTMIHVATEQEGLQTIFEVFKNFLKANGFDPEIFDFNQEQLDFDDE
jgi:hypothetical protein